MRTTHEVLPPDDAPAPEQLFELVACGVLRAKAYGKLREPPHSKGHVRAAVLPYAETISPVVEGLPEYALGRTLSMRIARTDFRKWSMRIISRQYFTYSAMQETEDWSLPSATQVDTYGFKWNRHITTNAWRRLHAYPVPSTEVNGLQDVLDHFTVSDDLVTLWHAQTQLEQVTGADVLQLMGMIEQYADDSFILTG